MHGLLFLRNVHSVPCGLVSVSLSSIFDGQLRYAQFFFVTIRNSVASPAEKWISTAGGTKALKIGAGNIEHSALLRKKRNRITVCLTNRRQH